MRHEYEKSYEQDGFVLPIPCVRSSGFDPETFLEVLASYWNQYFALKPTLMQFSVLTFFPKIAKCVLDMRRSLQVVSFRVMISICMPMD